MPLGGGGDVGGSEEQPDGTGEKVPVACFSVPVATVTIFHAYCKYQPGNDSGLFRNPCGYFSF